MPSIRELFANLGFKVDTTPATRFNAAVNRSKKTLQSLTQVRVGRFGTRLKKMFKVAAGGVVAVGAASLVAANKFTDVARGLKQLESQFKGKFKPLKKEIDSILTDKTLGKLTTELELVNTAAGAFETGLDPDVFIKNLRPALEFAIVNRKNVGEITSAITAFIGEADLDLLIKAGQLNQRQIELLKAAGTGPGQAGIIARTARIEQLFAGIGPDIRKRLEELVESGVLSQKQLLTTFDETVKELGENTLPAIREITKQAIGLLDEFRGRAKKENVIEAFFKTFFKLPEGRQLFLPEFGGVEEDVKISKDPAVGKFFRKLLGGEFTGLEGGGFAEDVKVGKGQEAGKFFRELFKFAFPGLTEARLRAERAISGINRPNQPGQSTSISVSVKVEAGATGDPTVIKQAVGDELRRVMGTVKEQSDGTTRRRGGD